MSDFKKREVFKVADDLLDVFDVKENKYLVKGISRQAVANMLGITRRAISECLARPGRIQGRYEITRSESESNVLIKKDPKVPDSWCKEWDEMTVAAELIRTGQGCITTKTIDGKKVKVTVPKGAVL